MSATPVRSGASQSIVASVAAILFALVPGALTVYLGFRAGGFFIGATAAVTMVLLLLLAGRVIATARPAEGINGSLAVALTALVLLTLWTLLSSRWSHSPSRALIEFDRALLYVLALAVFGSMGMDPHRLRWMLRGIALAIVVVCGAGLVTRLLPDVWPLVYGSISPRLSYPVTYWNAFGVLAAIGITICFGLTSSEREQRLVRVLAAAAIPVLASALLLTLSRGGVATAVLGVLVFAIVGHPRGLLSGLLAVAPATAVAIVSTYGAELLVSADHVTAAAQAQGHRVAVVVGLCAVCAGALRSLLLYVDDFVVRLRPSPATRRQLLGVAASVLLLSAGAGAVIIDAPAQYQAFITSGASNESVGSKAATNDPRTRLTTITDSGRIEHWDIALDEFTQHVAQGRGAGTFEHSWNEHRTSPGTVIDAHSLYAEILGELGLAGLALLLIALLTIIVGIARRVRGEERALFATIFAAIVAWAVAAGFDWHWEMPVVTMWVFALGGAAIAGARARKPAGPFLGILPRSLIATACLVLLALVPLQLMISQNRLQFARAAYQDGRCTDVSAFTKQSRDAVGSRPEPHELIAGCQLRRGRGRQAISSMRAAVRRDPDSWRVHYSLAVAQAHAGEDPRPEIRRARRLNPLNSLVERTAVSLERADGRKEWRAAARRLKLEVLVPRI